MPRRGGAAVLALCLLLGACTDRPEARRGPTPVPGGILRVAVRDLGSLDPAKAARAGSVQAVAQVFDSLTAIDPQTGRVMPAAAASWSSSPDGRRWSFRLREAAFHDGRPVTAADFERAFDRIARRRTGSQAAFQLEPVAGFAATNFAGTASSLSGVSAPSARVLRITLDAPFAELPVLVSHPALGPLHPRYASSTRGLDTSPIGNGPFRVASVRRGRSARLVRNDTYRGAASYLDAIEFRVVRDVNDGWRQYLAGAVDVSEAPPSALQNERDRVGTAGMSPFWAAVYYGPNLRLAKYAKPEVRRALSLAIDRAALARSVYSGSKDPATGIIPRGVRGFARNACDVCTPDRARARTILRAAFPARPLRVVIDHLDAPLPRSEAQAIASNLRGVGVRATLRKHTASAYRSLLRTGRHDFAELGWLAEVPTPDGFLGQQLGSGSRDNPTGFADRQFDRLIERARAARDEDVRLAAYREAERRALALMPLVPIVFFRNRLAVARHVRAFSLDGAGAFDASGVWLARGRAPATSAP